MASPSDRVYSETHEWHQVAGDMLTLGLTRYAVDTLTDVTFVQIKGPGTKCSPGKSIGEVESVKTTSDIYCACEGEIVEVNKSLEAEPGLLNADPFGKGWLCKVKISDKSGLARCTDAAAYDKAHPAG